MCNSQYDATKLSQIPQNIRLSPTEIVTSVANIHWLQRMTNMKETRLRRGLD